MPTYTVNQFYLGVFADLDPTEASSLSGQRNNHSNELTQVAGWGPGVVFDSSNMQLLTFEQNDTVREGNTERLEENDFKARPSSIGGPLGADSFTYDLGNGPITSDIDSTFVWNVEFLHGDGTTSRQTVGFIQLENGAIFSNFTGAQTGTKNIQSFRLISHDSSLHYGAGANRNVGGIKIVCFSSEVLVLTPSGEVAVGDLSVGDLVMTRDNGAQPIRWLSKRRLGSCELRAMSELLPVCIREGVLGHGLPRRDLMVSPQHRVLVWSRISDRLYGSNGVLVAAKHLMDLPGVASKRVDAITYVHFACRRHEIVFAEGAPVESFYPGPMAIAALEPEARAELLELFPELEAEGQMNPARPMLAGRASRDLARRHHKNGVALVS